MKDKNEFGRMSKEQVQEVKKFDKATEARKSNVKTELNELVLDLSLGIKNNSHDKLKTLLKGVKFIRNVKVRGMIADAAYNMHFILNTLEDLGVTVSNVDLEVEM